MEQALMDQRELKLRLQALKTWVERLDPSKEFLYEQAGAFTVDKDGMRRVVEQPAEPNLAFDFMRARVDRNVSASVAMYDQTYAHGGFPNGDALRQHLAVKQLEVDQEMERIALREQEHEVRKQLYAFLVAEAARIERQVKP